MTANRLDSPKTPAPVHVKGAIQSKFFSSGGVDALGYAITNQQEITIDGQRHVEQKFERATIRWSSSTGAFLVR